MLTLRTPFLKMSCRNVVRVSKSYDSGTTKVEIINKYTHPQTTVSNNPVEFEESKSRQSRLI
jgi:hypothetical protein